MLNNKKGQALVEYVLIIALVSVVIIGLVKIFGGYLKDSMTKTSCGLVKFSTPAMNTFFPKMVSAKQYPLEIPMVLMS